MEVTFNFKAMFTSSFYKGLLLEKIIFDGLSASTV